MSEVQFDVEESGRPQLAGEGEPAPPPPPGLAPTLELGLVAGWSHQEACRFAASIMTTALMIAYVIRHKAFPTAVEDWKLLGVFPEEFTGTGLALQPVMDRFIPKDAGGGLVVAAVGSVSIAPECVLAVVRREQLFRNRPDPGRAAVPQAPSAPPDPAADQGEGFRFGPEHLEVLSNNRAPQAATTEPRI